MSTSSGKAIWRLRVQIVLHFAIWPSKCQWLACVLATTMASHSILGKRCPETAPNDWEQAPPVLGDCRSGWGCIIVGHVFLQLPVSVSSRNKQGYAWLALHEVAAKRRPRSGILQWTQSYRRGSENCNPQFLLLPLLSTGGWTRNLLVPWKLCLSAPPDFRQVFVLFLPWRR